MSADNSRRAHRDDVPHRDLAHGDVGNRRLHKATGCVVTRQQPEELSCRHNGVPPNAIVAAAPRWLLKPNTNTCSSTVSPGFLQYLLDTLTQSQELLEISQRLRPVRFASDPPKSYLRARGVLGNLTYATADGFEYKMNI